MPLLQTIHAGPEIDLETCPSGTFMVLRWSDARSLIDHPTVQAPYPPFWVEMAVMEAADPEISSLRIMSEGAPRSIFERMPPLGGYAARADITDTSRDRLFGAIASLFDLSASAGNLFITDGHFASDVQGCDGYKDAILWGYVSVNLLAHISALSNHRLLKISQTPELRFLARMSR